MKFSQVAKGTFAEKRTTFRHHGEEVVTLLRPLSAGEEIAVISKARASAVKSGVLDPKPGDSIYEAHLQSETLVLACLDPDSPPVAGRTSTFDEGPAQVLEMDGDTILMLHEQHKIWQEECSPSIRVKSTKELFEIAKAVASSDDPFFYARLSPSTRWQLLVFMAALLLKSPDFKAWSSSISSEGTTSSDGSAATSRPTTTAAEGAKK